jgi:quercetin dioxygenase-like cupin family protein
MNPVFDRHTPPSVSAELTALLPRQGSFELQHDQPAKIHDWHHHSLDEELFIMRGDVVLFWDADGTYREQHCAAGTWITLPAGTVHGSVAGAEGAIYIIRPQDGRTAQTTFLEPAEHPHPTPQPVGSSA